MRFDQGVPYYNPYNNLIQSLRAFRRASLYYKCSIRKNKEKMLSFLPEKPLEMLKRRFFIHFRILERPQELFLKSRRVPRRSF